MLFLFTYILLKSSIIYLNLGCDKMSKVYTNEDYDKNNRFKTSVNDSNINSVNIDNVKNTNVLGVFEDISQFLSSDICELELCELAIFQNFRLVEMSMPQFLNEVFLED